LPGNGIGVRLRISVPVVQGRVTLNLAVLVDENRILFCPKGLGNSNASISRDRAVLESNHGLTSGCRCGLGQQCDPTRKNS
jgi:hypothetical protein